MKKEWQSNKGQLNKEIVEFAKRMEFGKQSYLKIKRRELFTRFIEQYPLKYQREDRITLNYLFFCNKVIECNVCSIWKINRKRTKIFKFSRRKIMML